MNIIASERGANDGSEERSDEDFSLVAPLLVDRSATIIIASSLRSSLFAQRALIVLVSNSLHRQQQVRY